MIIAFEGKEKKKIMQATTPKKGAAKKAGLGPK